MTPLSGSRAAAPGALQDAWPARSRRLKPSFLLIGAQKGGTTSFYFDLCEHPDLAPALRKELHFFDRLYGRGVRWYARQFPRPPRRVGVQTGDVTPAYLYYPPAAARARALLPEVKLLLTLRDPVERAWSHYRHNVRKGIEQRPFLEAIRADIERIYPRVQEAQAGAPWTGEWDDQLVRFSYVSRGLYAQQLRRWLAQFPRERFFIVRSEQLRWRTRETLAQAAAFLGLAPFGWPRVAQRNVGGDEPVPLDAASLLRDFYQQPNAALADLLGDAFDFNAQPDRLLRSRLERRHHASSRS